MVTIFPLVWTHRSLLMSDREGCSKRTRNATSLRLAAACPPVFPACSTSLDYVISHRRSLGPGTTFRWSGIGGEGILALIVVDLFRWPGYAECPGQNPDRCQRNGSPIAASRGCFAILGLQHWAPMWRQNLTDPMAWSPLRAGRAICR